MSGNYSKRRVTAECFTGEHQRDLQEGPRPLIYRFHQNYIIQPQVLNPNPKEEETASKKIISCTVTASWGCPAPVNAVEGKKEVKRADPTPQQPQSSAGPLAAGKTLDILGLAHSGHTGPLVVPACSFSSMALLQAGAEVAFNTHRGEA